MPSVESASLHHIVTGNELKIADLSSLILIVVEDGIADITHESETYK